MAQILVNVSWRDIPWLEAAKLSDVEGSSAFLRTKAPMPVGTMLIVSPVDNAEIRVPVRVASVIEVPEAGSGASQGINVSLESAADLLQPYLSDDPTPVVGLAPEPAFGGAEQDVGDVEEPRPAREPARVDAAGDLPEAPRVELDLPADESRNKKDSGLMPSVSGEISMGEGGGPVGDPDAPDKVIVMVDAELPEVGAEPAQGFDRFDEEGSGPASDEEDQQAKAQGSSDEEDQQAKAQGSSEDEQGTEGSDPDNGKRKRKRRGKRRKKKK